MEHVSHVSQAVEPPHVEHVSHVSQGVYQGRPAGHCAERSDERRGRWRHVRHSTANPREKSPRAARSSRGHGDPGIVEYGSVENARGSAFLLFQDGRTQAAQPLPAGLLQRGFRFGIGEPLMRCSPWKAGWHTVPHAGCLAAFNWQAAADCGAARAQLCSVCAVEAQHCSLTPQRVLMAPEW